MARKSTGKKQRFRIFNRDGFRCRYCGRTSAEVILHADHIVSVSEGGGNDDSNLVTACSDCNLGKGKNRLVKGVVPPIGPLDTLMQEQELRELERYQEVLNDVRDKRNSIAWDMMRHCHMLAGDCCEVEEKDGELHAINASLASLRSLITKDVSPSEIMYAMDETFSRKQYWGGNQSYKAWRYFFAIIRNITNDKERDDDGMEV